MGPKKRAKGIEDEAACAEEDLSESSSDDDDSSLGGFIVPDGQLSDSNYDMEDSEIEEPAPAPAPKKRGRPPTGRAKSAAKTKADTFKTPGDSSYPLNDFSLTITKTGGDVSRDAIDRVAEFIEKYCLKGGVSTEVGQRAFNLHLQSLFRIRWPVRKDYVQRLQKILRGVLPENGKLYKVMVKAFGSNQSFSAMVGYITKDQGTDNFCKRLIFYFYFFITWLFLQDKLIMRSAHIISLAKSSHMAAAITMLC